jgi:hypothetical protein
VSSGCGWRNGLQLWRLAANILNKQSRTDNKGWSSSLGFGRGAIHKLINSVWHKEELPDQWKKFTKKGDKTDCNNYRDISLLSTSYKILPNIVISRSSPYIDENIGDHQCGFRRN